MKAEAAPVVELEYHPIVGILRGTGGTKVELTGHSQVDQQSLVPVEAKYHVFPSAVELLQDQSADASLKITCL